MKAVVKSSQSIQTCCSIVECGGRQYATCDQLCETWPGGAGTRGRECDLLSIFGEAPTFQKCNAVCDVRDTYPGMCTAMHALHHAAKGCKGSRFSLG